MTRTQRHNDRPVLRMVLLALVVTLLGTFLPAVADAAPANTTPQNSGSVSLNGGPMVLGAPPADLQILGAPGVPSAPGVQSLSGPVTLGWGCWKLEFACKLVKPIAVGVVNCSLILYGRAKECFESAAKPVVNLIGAGVKEVQRMLIRAVNKGLVNNAVFMTDLVMNDILLGDNAIASPRLDPTNSFEQTPAPANVKNQVDSSWFVQQAGLMRTIGIYIIAPLMMLVIMQAIVKGSIFFLLRSALIILPLAIFGSVVLVQMTDLMLGIADDMSEAIAASVVGDREAFKTDLTTTFNNIAEAPEMSFFTTFWLLIMSFGFIAIFIELLIRETGIYLAAFFLPLAFSAMVWPTTAKWARRLVELLLGLIFSKVFIVAALTLGIAGMQASVSPDPVPEGTDPELAAVMAVEHATASAASVSAILIFAAVAGAKIMTFAPGMDGASQGRIVNTRNAWGKGQAVAAGAGSAKAKSGKMLSNIKPRGNFSNP